LRREVSLATSAESFAEWHFFLPARKSQAAFGENCLIAKLRRARDRTPDRDERQVSFGRYSGGVGVADCF